MALNSVICIDVETGGLDCSENPMTQIAFQAFELENNKPIIEYSSYIKPYKGFNNKELKYDQKALDYTGINLELLQIKGKDIKVVVNELCDAFSKANTANSHMKKPILLGHNIGFDVGFIQYAFLLHKLDIGKYLDSNKNYLGQETPKYFDTLLEAKQKWGNDAKMTKFNLAACCQKAGIELVDAHDAFNDVKATKLLFQYFTSSIRSIGGSIANEKNEHTSPRKHFQF